MVVVAVVAPYVRLQPLRKVRGGCGGSSRPITQRKETESAQHKRVPACWHRRRRTASCRAGRGDRFLFYHLFPDSIHAQAQLPSHHTDPPPSANESSYQQMTSDCAAPYRRECKRTSSCRVEEGVGDMAPASGAVDGSGGGGGGGIE